MRRAMAQPPDLPGYEYVKLLGSGGFSDVYLYEQQLPKRRVAVKVLLTEDLTGSNRAAFVAEANLMAQLSAHPYIVTIYQADVAGDDRPYFVMEYCSGPSLAERYKRESFSVADALRTGIRVASAVATAHSAGILHRDIKPANVLSNDYGWPALTDFGISSAVDDESIPLHTGTLASALQDTGSGTESQSVGMSVPWSPPEMFEDDPAPDVRSDVFSLAATIYTILAGQTPFEVRGRSNGTLDLIGRIERGAVTPMARDDVPRSLLAVLSKGMASDRTDRFATAVDFARALQRVELELGYAPTTIEVPNLHIAAPTRDEQGDADDETRARSVSTIQAQPTATPATAFTPPPTTTATDDPTMLRGSQRVDAQPSGAEAAGGSTEVHDETVVRKRPDATPPVEPEPSPVPTSRRNRLALWIAGGAAALVAAAVAAALIFGGGAAPDPDAPDASDGPGESAIVSTIPTPEIVSVVPDASTVTFTVANPEAEEGDVFVWRLAGRSDSEPLRPSASEAITVPDYVAGATVCIEVSILRSGKTSSVPLESCYPA